MCVSCFIENSTHRELNLTSLSITWTDHTWVLEMGKADLSDLIIKRSFLIWSLHSEGLIWWDQKRWCFFFFVVYFLRFRFRWTLQGKCCLPRPTIQQFAKFSVFCIVFSSLSFSFCIQMFFQQSGTKAAGYMCFFELWIFLVNWLVSVSFF